jgi:hypothetical protein
MIGRRLLNGAIVGIYEGHRLGKVMALSLILLAASFGITADLAYAQHSSRYPGIEAQGQPTTTTTPQPILEVEGQGAVVLVTLVGAAIALIWLLPISIDASRAYKAQRKSWELLVRDLAAYAARGRDGLTVEELKQLLAFVGQSPTGITRLHCLSSTLRRLHYDIENHPEVNVAHQRRPAFVAAAGSAAEAISSIRVSHRGQP